MIKKNVSNFFFIIYQLIYSNRYNELSQFVDQMFPPLNKDRLVEPHDDFNSFLYWRTDIPIIDDNELIGSTNGLSSVLAK